jgi:hypothetical protein
MRLIASFGAVLFIILIFAGHAPAWEFELKGETEWRYRYWSRTGDRDIFGTMGDDVNLGINHLATFPTAVVNNPGGPLFGVLAGENNFGKDMSFTDYRMTLYPTFKVGRAIEISASVNLTSLGIWSDGEPYVAGTTSPPPSPANPGYVNSLYAPLSTKPVASNVPNTYVTLQWLRTFIRTPAADFGIGYKASRGGIGLRKHKSVRSSASFSISTRYGPFKFRVSPYFSRRASDWRAADSRNEGARAPQRKELVRNYAPALQSKISYMDGPLKIGFAVDSYKQAGAPAVSRRGAAISPGRPDRDVLRYRFQGSIKYFNGRFFLNGEVNSFNRWRSGRGVGPNPPATDLVREGIDHDGWLYGGETGVLVGPCKLTANYVRATGNNIATRETDEDAVSGAGGASSGYMKDWGLLMYEMYGAGTNFGADGNGQPTDFHHIGGRLDHAVAANLNLYVLFSYAWRDQPNAWTLGGDYRLGLRRFDNDDLLNLHTGASSRTPVPDHARGIGWEVDFGVDWKLLEHLIWSAEFAYWKPGNWWAYAYPNTAAIYRNNGLAAIVANQAWATIGAGRDIDPLLSMETRLSVAF